MFFWKTAPPSPPPKPHDLMQALTYKDILAHTQLEHHARHLAVKGEPATNHAGVSAPEADTIDLIEHRIAGRAGELDAQTAALVEEVQLLAAAPDLDPPILQQRTIDSITGLFAARTPAIHQGVAEERTRRALLTAWRDEHHIVRPAQYPKSRVVHYRWLLGVVGFETLLQASMLMPATPDGLLGAAALGLAIATLTTSLGLAIGYGALRYIAAPGVTKKSLGVLALPVLTSLLVFISLYVAHYRHLAGVNDEAPSDAVVFEHLIDQPFDLSGQGVILFLLSLGCAAFAAWKGYNASDPIPGYEAVDRAYVDARDDLNYLRNDIRGAVGAIRDTAVAPLLRQPKLVRAKADHLNSLLIGLQHRRDRIAALDNQEIALAQRAIAQFRRLNLATRADGITPAYFSETPVIVIAPPQVPAELESRIATASQQATTNAAKAAELGLHVARLLDRTNDCTDEIMASVAQTNQPKETNPTISLRSTLEQTLSAVSLPPPSGHVSLPPSSAQAP
jgi:hypothetical protein